MKISKLIVCAAVVVFAACGRTPDQKVGSTGKPFEVFVVMGDEDWKGAAGDTLRSILLEEIPTLAQHEARFDIFRIMPKNYKGLVAQHRNLVNYQISPKYKKPSMTAEYDVNARPQIVVNITGPSDSTVIAYMSENREALQRIFEIAERDRFVASATKFSDPEILAQIQKTFDMKMGVPKGYRVRSVHPDFMWISYEMPLVSQGFFIYKYPYVSRATFTEPYLVEKRNQFAKLIPGPSKGSYMTTSEEIPPVLGQMQINGRIWFTLHGFWDVANDFMGGPFQSYTTVNTAKNEVVTIDCYVFSPKYDKRNYIRQLESLIFTVDFPSDSTSVVKVPEVGAE